MIDITIYVYIYINMHISYIIYQCKLKYGHRKIHTKDTQTHQERLAEIREATARFHGKSMNSSFTSRVFSARVFIETDPLPSMYGIFTYICLFLMVKYGKCR